MNCNSWQRHGLICQAGSPMMRNPVQNRILWIVTAALVLAASLAGVINPSIYSKVITEALLPGVVAQDAMSVVAAIVLLALAITAKPSAFNAQIIILGILGYLFYVFWNLCYRAGIYGTLPRLNGGVLPSLDLIIGSSDARRAQAGKPLLHLYT
jgi:hypothetical protein